ncbi:MAG: hypothetical protein KME16_16000 [Scytolyngbya sp. HA4215-MV1]|nr:hypothetical protein [Scytolyngbya sp. HA4215-MV1]
MPLPDIVDRPKNSNYHGDNTMANIIGTNRNANLIGTNENDILHPS